MAKRKNRLEPEGKGGKGVCDADAGNIQKEGRSCGWDDTRQLEKPVSRRGGSPDGEDTLVMHGRTL